MWSFPAASGLPLRDPATFPAAVLPQGEHPSAEHSSSTVCSSPCVQSRSAAEIVVHSFTFWSYHPWFYCPYPSSCWAVRAELHPAAGTGAEGPNTCTCPRSCGCMLLIFWFFCCCSGWYLVSLVPISGSSSCASNNFHTCHKPCDPAIPGKLAWCLHPPRATIPGALFALMTSEVEEASQGFRSVHGCQDWYTSEWYLRQVHFLMPFVDFSFLIPPAETQTVATSATWAEKFSLAIICIWGYFL